MWVEVITVGDLFASETLSHQLLHSNAAIYMDMKLSELKTVWVTRS